MKEKFDKEIIQDIIQWDAANWQQAIDYWDEILSSKKDMLCLEVGARKGGLSLLAALYGHRAVCSDIENPAEFARPLHKKYKVENMISYEAVDLLNIPYENKFDIIFLKSVLPTVGANNNKALQQKAITEMYKSLKPGGYLLFAENLEASSLHRFARKNFVAWGSAVRYLKLKEIKEMTAAFSSVDYTLTGFLGLFGRTESQRKFLGKIDSLTKNLIPSSWKYLVIGKVRK